MREPIPPAVAADVLYESDRTCCVCNEPGRPTQVHHIDSDPANNSPGNLCVLCLLCHNETEVRGGFGRHLTAPVVTRYRDAWVARVADRRVRADELAARLSVGLPATGRLDDTVSVLKRLPDVRFEALRSSTPKWQSGINTEMAQGSYDYIAALRSFLLELVARFPSAHFTDDVPERFLSSWQSQLFAWHRARLEPDGIGTGGSIISAFVAGCVSHDLERMIEQLVEGLSDSQPSLDFVAWRRRWRRRPRSGKSGT